MRCLIPLSVDYPASYPAPDCLHQAEAPRDSSGEEFYISMKELWKVH